ncbi:MAG: hypothetical protein IT452_11365 [Planctomycetia bacterium]|nr:hypothetical protein [Planctomycetia bacterium]
MRWFLPVLVLSAAALAVRAEEATVLRGRVVDADARGVAGVDIGDNWQLGPDSRPYSGLRTGEDGSFEIALRYFRPPVALLAMDAKRERGAAVVVTAESAKEPLVLVLAPTAEVKGELACEDPEVSPVGSSVQWQFGKARIGNLHATSAAWSVRLPPGPWGFWTYHPDTAPLSKSFDVPADGTALDLGKLPVAPNALATLRGKPFPDWKVSDARGVDKSVQPSSYKGKWLLVEFWGFW